MLKRATLFAVTLAIAPAAYASSNTTVLGATANQPKGPGHGQVLFIDPATRTASSASFAKAGTLAGNSFYAGYDAATKTIFVPSPVGRVTVLNEKTGHRVGTFSTIKGARVADVLGQKKLLMVLSGKSLAAYSLPGHTPLFTIPVGGNALATNRSETKLFVGGNMDRKITIVDIPSGRIAGTYPVAGSGDLLMARGNLFSADIKTGVMSVVNTATGKVTRIKTPEVDPHFSYAAIPHATAGFMQLAKSPDQQVVYSAGFSGHILKFSAEHPKYLGEIPVRAGEGMSKLSGLAIVQGGKDALVTVENRHEAALVDLKNGKILHVFKGDSSNRWVVARS
ncbi:hypothetical protein GCM10008024_28810 [Allgaiera indica]|uniref:Uncharacterized protein n=1 Tax=Allgaiera indica TaxID=765699 RepID=A0AAN4USZ1_9RHOB|nr:hypothetical protein [Allgaiera indica]GHE03873.1 hypothetical protein GCM10008024_28810 [Allgaiera indica]SDX36397.1 hypothetical protein SAMN05444006_114100 [Allgaiera indica]